MSYMITPYYQNKYVTLYCGDCLEVMPQLDMTFDACITDPPYGTTACKWDNVIPFEDMWRELKRLVKPNGVVCLFGSEPFSSKLRCSNLEMFKYDWIWVKSKGSCTGFIHAKNMPMKQHEIISCFSQCAMGHLSLLGNNRMVYNPQNLIHKPTPKSSKAKFGSTIGKRPSQVDNYIREYINYPTSVLSFTNEKGLHPTQKPTALLEYLIKTYTQENECVLDFTAGSGTAGVAAMETNRKCVLIEKEEKYCQITVQRLQDKEKQIAERLF